MSFDGLPYLLMRAAAEFRRGGWIFTGFNWPVLAGHLAWSLPGSDFVEVFEGGAVCAGRPDQLPTSTTDYAAYQSTLVHGCGSLDVLTSIMRRVDVAVLDAATVDLTGRINSSMVGDSARPKVRLPGGGGAPDVLARARRVVLLFAATDLRRLERRVEHVTGQPNPAAEVRLVTRWGELRLGQSPQLLEIAEGPGSLPFVQHLEGLGVHTGDAVAAEPVSSSDQHAVVALLREAAARGYVVPRRIVKEHL